MNCFKYSWHNMLCKFKYRKSFSKKFYNYLSSNAKYFILIMTVIKNMDNHFCAAI